MPISSSFRIQPWNWGKDFLVLVLLTSLVQMGSYHPQTGISHPETHTCCTGVSWGWSGHRVFLLAALSMDLFPSTPFLGVLAFSLAVRGYRLPWILCFCLWLNSSRWGESVVHYYVCTASEMAVEDSLLPDHRKTNNMIVPYLNHKSRNTLIRNMHRFSRFYVNCSFPANIRFQTNQSKYVACKHLMSTNIHPWAMH